MRSHCLKSKSRKPCTIAEVVVLSLGVLITRGGYAMSLKFNSVQLPAEYLAIVDHDTKREYSRDSFAADSCSPL